MAALGKAAAALAAKGLRVFPLQPRDKKPDGQLAPHGCKDASADAAEIAAWWEASPEANIGIATGEASGIWVLDVDGADGMSTLAELVAAHGPLPKTVVSITGGGKHYLFKWPADGISNSAKKLGPGLDTRGAGGYIVAPPSVHPNGTKYAWANTSGKAILDAPDWLLSLLKKPARKKAEVVTSPATPDFQAVPEAYGRKALESEYDAVASAGEGTRNGALNKAAFNMGTLAAVDGVKWPDVNRTLTAAAAANGYLAEEGAPHVEAVIRSGFESGLQHPREVKPSNKPARGQRPRLVTDGNVAIAAAPDPETQSEYNLTKDKTLKANCLHNARLMLSEQPALNGLFALNDFTNEIWLTRRPPWAVNGFKPQGLRETDVTNLASYLAGLKFTISLTHAYAAIQQSAEANHFDPVSDALRALQWDGRPRLDHWLIDYMDAADVRFVREVGAKWLIGAAARVLKPGSKVDTMLILEGPQGLKKSTALAAIATIDGQEFFADKLPALETKDAALEIQGKVIVEIAELDALRKAEVSQIKAYLSQRFDRFRPPYGRIVIERPRRCVFAGTVNPGASGYLNDPTGGRRFWPVSVQHIALDELRAAVPQLWAEAVHRYQAGESWWIDEETAAEAREQQRDRYELDVWAEKIDKVIRTQPSVRTTDILKELEIPVHLWTLQAQKRIGAHLRFRNWVRKKARQGEDGHPTWVFFPPDSGDDLEEK